MCRARTSHLNGAEIQPCVTPVSERAGQTVTMIEGLASGDDLHPVQQAWLEQTCFRIRRAVKSAAAKMT
ncbi:hypothetical protein ABZX92_18465 [Lentzea sp. NPDC006480]|uniref:hypothetical protein n=1 Tax=Lentzea sp. NPDC006480 TaxID=3157176 RepID=UPI0033BBFF38